MTNEKINIPQTIEKELFTCIGVGKWNFNKVQTTDFNGSLYSSEGWENILLKKQTIIINLSDSIVDENTIKQELVAQLREQLKKVKAEAHQKEKAIQEKIDNLLAIEYQPEVITDPRHPRANTIGG